MGLCCSKRSNLLDSEYSPLFKPIHVQASPPINPHWVTQDEFTIDDEPYSSFYNTASRTFLTPLSSPSVSPSASPPNFD